MHTKTASQDTAFIKAAWLEWIVAHLSRTGDGDRYLPMSAEVAKWFTARELGLGTTDGPSIFWTLAHLPQINRAHRALLACRELPKPKRERVQDAAERRRREWRAVLRFRRAELAAAA